MPPNSTGSELDLLAVATGSSTANSTQPRPSGTPRAMSTSSETTAATTGMENTRVGLPQYRIGERPVV